MTHRPIVHRVISAETLRCFRRGLLLGPFVVLAACGRLAGSGGTKPPANRALWNEFSGARAFAHVEAQVGFGPRPSGSAALEKTRGYLETQLRDAGWNVERQAFTDNTPRGPIGFVNLVARFGKADAGKPRAILCTHYDTKVFDNVRFVGANDGGSGTGALLEMARVLSLEPGFARGFELVFFDGEEAVGEWTPTDSLYGSRHYARSLREGKRTGQFKFGILLDMIGDRDLTVTLPPDSPTKLVQGIFAATEALNTRRHFSFSRGSIVDDHVPLNTAGIPTIDLIDFDYPPWHTAADTLDKVSGESLEIIGRAVIYQLCQGAPDAQR